MTQALGRPAPLPYVDEGDILLLAGDLGAGVFPAADLYGWYAQAARQDGREPVGKKKFGLALKEAGWLGSIRYRGGTMVRCWMITKPWARRGAEHIRASTET